MGDGRARHRQERARGELARSAAARFGLVSHRPGRRRPGHLLPLPRPRRAGPRPQRPAAAALRRGVPARSRGLHPPLVPRVLRAPGAGQRARVRRLPRRAHRARRARAFAAGLEEIPPGITVVAISRGDPPRAVRAPRRAPGDRAPGRRGAAVHAGRGRGAARRGGRDRPARRSTGCGSASTAGRPAWSCCTSTRQRGAGADDASTPGPPHAVFEYFAGEILASARARPAPRRDGERAAAAHERAGRHRAHRTPADRAAARRRLPPASLRDPHGRR